ncbi:MAG: hypothetical protein AABX49_01190, partial [Nanoarchaeota archaeon]
LPGDGAQVVAERIFQYGDYKIPTTINFMSTPKKQGDELLRDLEGTILATRDLPYVDRLELNISCPNPPIKNNQIDTRKKNIEMLDNMLEVTDKNIYPHQAIF